MFSINVFFYNTEQKLGSSTMNNTAFDWNRNMAKSFEFVPSEEFQNNYVLGKFFLKDCVQQEQKNEKTTDFYVSCCKFLCRNKDPHKQFDDEANSKWEEFPNNEE
ncbi:MAG: hypothetical protein Q4P16_09960 [Spirochaetales bacterium]|nr:hypothetical protein [Spirochaetales bacterium]